MFKKTFITTFIILILSSCFQGSGNSNQTQSGENIEISSTQTVQIFALGDSLTAGFGVPLEDSYPFQLQQLLSTHSRDYRVINAGVSGNTSAELKGRLDWVLGDVQSGDIAILVIGGNDGLRGMSLTDLESNILSIIDILKEKEMRVVLGGMQIPPNLGLRYTRDFEALYKNIARSNRDIYFMEFFLEGVAADPTLNLSDMIHPNRLGYEIITQNIYNFLVSNGLIGSR